MSIIPLGLKEKRQVFINPSAKNNLRCLDHNKHMEII